MKKFLTALFLTLLTLKGIPSFAEESIRIGAQSADYRISPDPRSIAIGETVVIDKLLDGELEQRQLTLNEVSTWSAPHRDPAFSWHHELLTLQSSSDIYEIQFDRIDYLGFPFQAYVPILMINGERVP